MIISHKHKLIVVKSWKTAGTSIEDMLAPHLDDGELYREGEKQHVPPDEVQKMVGKDVWDEYLKVLPVRNPWDAMVSLYFFSAKQMKEGLYNESAAPPPWSFRRFVWWNQTGFRPLNKEYGRMWVWRNEKSVFADWADMYIRHENIEADCKLLMDKLGLPFEGVPRSNISPARPKGIHYSMLYDETTKSTIEKAYKFEIDFFNYKFEHWRDL